jgi:hypothetical protein
MTYGDRVTEYNAKPAHSFSSSPPYLINMKGVDDDTVTSISMSGNSLTAVDTSRYENLLTLDVSNNSLTAVDIARFGSLTTLDVSNNLLPKSEISELLISLDEAGQLSGSFTATNNISGSLSSDGLTAYNNLVTKSWSLTDVV